jgi:fructokinase
MTEENLRNGGADRRIGTVVAVGEVLFDVFPEGRHLGGAPFNFVYQLHSLGFPVCFVSAVGDDDEGREILRFMERNGMRTDCVGVLPGSPTGRVVVSVDGEGIPEYDILVDRAWDRIPFSAAVEGLLHEDISLFCYGTLAQRSALSRRTVGALLDRLDPGILRVCDINIRQQYYSRTLVGQCLRNADLLKLNEEEVDLIAGLFDEMDPEEFAGRLVEDNLLRCLCLTRGGAGSELRLPGGGIIRHAIDPGDLAREEMKDTVGAGDAYTAMLCAGYLKGLGWERALGLASRFAAAICTVRGALPENRKFYKPFIEELTGTD